MVRPDGTVNGRRHWHGACAGAWRFANDPSYAREVLFARDRGNCALCQTYDPLWQADHKHPLALAGGDLFYWTAANVWTLCRACHAAKTKDDMALIRAARAPGCIS